jgi:hypothetical protein
MFAEAAGAPDAYTGVGWTVVDRVGAPGFADTLLISVTVHLIVFSADFGNRPLPPALKLDIKSTL